MKRKNAKNCMLSAKTVISCALNYYHPISENDFDGGFISSYARNQDYHKVMSKKFKQLAHFIKLKIPTAELKPYCDTGPILEKAYAQESGIGWIGKNSCLINSKLGSWFFLGEILTNISLIPDTPANNYCGSCQKCIDICPTQAIIKPYQIDSRRCIAYLTIELREEIPKEFRHGVGKHLFGCDLCQDVCPWNRKPTLTQCNDFYPRKELLKKSYSDWLRLSEEDFKLIFKQNPVKRSKWRGFLRNAIVMAGNSKNQKLIPLLKELLDEKEPLLLSHIEWAIDQLKT